MTGPDDILARQEVEGMPDGSDFQQLSRQIAKIDGMKPSQMTPMEPADAADFVEQRAAIAREILGIGTAQALLREWAARFFSEVATSPIKQEVIERYRNDDALRVEETKIAGALGATWVPGRHAGVIEHYMHRALDGLEFALFGEKVTAGKEPKEVSRIRGVNEPEDWELAWPKPERLKQIMAEVKAKKITLEEGIALALERGLKATPKPPVPRPTGPVPAPAGPTLEEETQQWGYLLANTETQGEEVPPAAPPKPPEPTPPPAEIKRSRSEFELLCAQIAEIEAKGSKAGTAEKQLRDDLIAKRAALATEILSLGVVKANLAIRMEGIIRDVASSDDPQAIIEKYRKQTTLDDAEADLAGNPLVGQIWSSKKHGGVIKYVIERAVNSLEFALFEETFERILTPQELQRYRQVIAPEPWEWQWPPADELRKVITLIKQEKKGAEEKLADALRETPEEIFRRRLEGKTLGEQRRIVIPMLDAIENSARDCLDYANNVSTRTIEATYASMHPEIVKECQVRLALHDSAELILQADGKITRGKEDHDLTIGDAVRMAKRRRHHITKTVIEYLFNENIRGVNFSFAWDLFQSTNFRYQRTLELINRNRPAASRLATTGFEFVDDEPMGKTPVNYFTDSTSERKNAVRNYMVNFLVRKGLSEREAEKSLQLAEKLTIATLETSIFNTSMTGSDDLSEIIYLRRWRKGRALPGKDRGPRCHEDLIPGFGQSWLRSMINLENDQMLTSHIIKKRVIGKIREGSWEYYGTVIVGRYAAMKGAILETTWEPQDRPTWGTQFTKMVAHFDTCDKPETDENTGIAIAKQGPLGLRGLWATGVLDRALLNKWTPQNIKDFMQALVQERLSETAGTFLSPNILSWILQYINLETRMAKAVGRETLSEMVGAIFPSGGGGGKRGGRK